MKFCVYMIILSLAACNKEAEEFRLDSGRKEQKSPLFQALQTFLAESKDASLDQIVRIIEERGFEIIEIDGGTEAGLTFFELLVNSPNDIYFIDVSGQIHGENQILVLDYVAVYSGGSKDVKELVFEWHEP